MARVKKKRSVVRIAVNVLLTALLAFLIFFLSVMLVDKYVKKSRLPSFFGYSQLVIATGSMEGTLDIGEMIFIKECADYEVGEIITFWAKDSDVTTTHTIVEKLTSGGVTTFITKGDANPTNDPDPVALADIEGKVIGSIPGIGIFIEWLKTPKGLFFFVAVTAVTVCLVIEIKRLCVSMLKEGESEEVAGQTGEDSEAGQTTAGQSEEHNGESPIVAESQEIITNENVEGQTEEATQE